MKDEIKTGKGWLELSKELEPIEVKPLSLKEFKQTLEELFNAQPVKEIEYWHNIIENMPPAAREIFEKLLKDEAEQFINNPKNKKYFK